MTFLSHNGDSDTMAQDKEESLVQDSDDDLSSIDEKYNKNRAEIIQWIRVK